MRDLLEEYGRYRAMICSVVAPTQGGGQGGGQGNTPCSLADWLVLDQTGRDQLMSCVNATISQLGTDTVREVDMSLTAGSAKYVGAVVAPNGKVYCCPYTSNTVLVVDTLAETAVEVATIETGGTKWGGAALSEAGLIYFSAWASSNVLKYDPSDDSQSVIAGGGPRFGASAVDGSVMIAPATLVATLIKVQMATDTVTTHGAFGGFLNWAGATLSTNGFLYCIPWYASTFLKIDPSDMSSTELGSIAGADKYIGGVLAPNGCIYGVPSSATAIVKIDPSTDTITTFGTVSGTNKYWGGVLAPNGMIYCIPRDATQVLKIDPSTDTASLVGATLTGTNKWNGGVVTMEGKIMGVPHDAANVLFIDPDSDVVFTEDVVLSAPWNKM